jgi:hypothetical protein
VWQSQQTNRCAALAEVQHIKSHSSRC